MTRRRWFLLLLGVVALVWVFGGEWISIHHGVPENHFLDALVGISFFGAGIVALDRRPGNVVGALMIAAAAVWFFGNWGNLDVPVLRTLGRVGGIIATPFLVHIFFVYPSGRVRSTFDRVVLWIVYVESFGVAVALVLTWDPHAFGCVRCPGTAAPVPSMTLADTADWIDHHVSFVLVPLFLMVIALRWRAASRAERRDLAPLWTAAALLTGVSLMNAFASSDPTDSFAYLLWELSSVLQIAVPLLFVWGLLSTRLAKSAVGDLVVQLEHAMEAEGMADALARAMGDPSVELVYALEGQDRWVDAAGIEVARPEATSGRGGRAVSVVERDGSPLAAIVHDPALDDGLVKAAAAAAGMAIANERLAAQVRAQLQEVRASRQRIVEAGDRERRRVERNLHDGAQQRLVTLSLTLRLLGDRGSLDPETAAQLEEACSELRDAIRDLRELARGIHPAILSDEGLGAAVESLAGRSPVPVEVRSDVDGRLPEPLEAAAYFVVSEALANVAKYSRASRATVSIERANGSLVVEVADDGAGGADASKGSGLRGLDDRVAAAGGVLRIESPVGSGTRIHAEIPLG